MILSKGTTPWDNINEKAGFVCQLYNDFEFVSGIVRIAKLNNGEFNKFMTSTYNNYVSETDSSESVLGHKNMFNDIISIISFVGLLISFIVKSDIPSRLLEGKLNK